MMANPLILLVRPAGFEPAAYGFEVQELITSGIKIPGRNAQ